MNRIRIIDRVGEVAGETRIPTGAAQNARRVPAAFARTFLNLEGATLEVETKRGWQPRVIVRRGASWYTRVPR